MTVDVEGVTPEETTVTAVENQPEDKAKAEDHEQATEGNQETPSDMSDEDIDKLLSNPKVKAKLEEMDTYKAPRQRAAIRGLEEQNKALRERVQKLESAEPPKKPNPSDFDTDEAYDDAMDEYRLDTKLHERELKDAKSQLEQTEAKEAQEREAEFTEKVGNYHQQEQAFIKDNPDYMQRRNVVQEYIDMFSVQTPDGRKVVRDAGAQEFQNALLEYGPELMNLVGSDPEKYIEPLMGKPPSWVKRKLDSYAKEIQAPPKPPEVTQLPEPPSKTKGAATPKKDPLKMEATELLNSIRS